MGSHRAASSRSRCTSREPLPLRSGALLRDYTLVYETYGTLNADTQQRGAGLPCAERDAPRRRHLRRPADRATAGGTTWSARASRSTPTASSSSASTTPARASARPGRCTSTRPPAAPGAPTSRSSRSRTGSTRRRACSTRWASTQLAAVIGGSLGGMQALSWSLRHPERRAPLHRGGHRAQPVGAEHRLQRGGAARHRHRPRLPRRPLLRARHAAAARPARGAHDRPHHLPLRRRDGAEVRPQPAQAGATLGYSTQDDRVRDRELPAPPGRQVQRVLRRQHLPADHARARLLRPGARARRRPERAPSPRRAAASCWSASRPTGASRRRARARSSRRWSTTGAT